MFRTNQIQLGLGRAVRGSKADKCLELVSVPSKTTEETRAWILLERCPF